MRSLDELLEHLGDIRQVAGIDQYSIKGGQGDSNHILQVRNGMGLKFDVNVSRGFDLGLCELFSVPVSWMSSCGRVSPYFYDKQGDEWNRGFEGGLMTTCGLTQAGKPNTDLDQMLGQHGRISYVPAELLQCELIQEHPERIVLRAKVRETKALSENISVYRTITTYLGKNEILIEDTVVNEGYEPVPHMILYHFNFGFPLISGTTKISKLESDRELIKGEADLCDPLSVRPVSRFEKPDVILHTNIKSETNEIKFEIENLIKFNNWNRRLKLTLLYNKEQCPYLTQWRYFGSGVNVFGIEPGNVSTKGRSYHRAAKLLDILEHGQYRQYNLKINFELKEDI